MNRCLLNITLAGILSVASLALSAHARAGQYLLFKGLNVTHSCMDGLIQTPTGGSLPAQPLVFTCSKFAYQDNEILVYDESNSSCISFEDFTATTGAEIYDTFIPYTGTHGELAGIVENLFSTDENTVVTFDSLTGAIIQGESTRCAEGGTPPPPVDIITKGAFLKASNALTQNYFGYSVALSANTAVIGAPWESSDSTGVNGDQTNSGATRSGAVYVFVFDAGAWSQQAYLKASNTDASDRFGHSVAISGDTIVVGADEERSNAQGVNGDQTNNLVSGAGAAYVFVRDGANWSQQAYLKASNTDFPGEAFGYSVATDGDVIVVGANEEASRASGVNGDETDNGSTSGAAYVFIRDGSSWSQEAYLKASNNNWDASVSRRFGEAVAVSGSTIVVGDYWEPSNATGVNGNEQDQSASRAGAAFVYHHDGANWSQQAYLKASNSESGDNFGSGVAISGDTIVVGAWAEDSNDDELDNSENGAGAAYVFTRNQTVWSQQAYLKASNVKLDQGFGDSVSLSGDALLVGAYREDATADGVQGSTFDNYGSAYRFQREGTQWYETMYLKASNADKADLFGWSVAVDGAGMVVGAYREDSDSQGIDGFNDNNLVLDSGAAYVFVPKKEIIIDLIGGPPIPGSVFIAIAQGFKPNTPVQAFLQSEPVLVGEEMADAEGNVTFEITIPLDFPPGDHSLILLGLNPDDSERRLTAPLSIVSSGVIFNDGFE